MCIRDRFWDISRTELLDIPGNKLPTPLEYRRRVDGPNLEVPKKRNPNEGHKSSRHASWTSPTSLYTFQGPEVEFALIYVEDTKYRKFVATNRHRKKVAIPFLVSANE